MIPDTASHPYSKNANTAPHYMGSTVWEMGVKRTQITIHK